jgi:GDP-4-dehydro-6-deoxy-D-mannose reductase
MVAITDAARRQATPPSLLVISSAEVYAAPSPGMKLTEASPIAPRTRYGRLKLAAESIAVACAMRFGLHLVVLRPFGHVGPGQPPVSAVASFAARVAAVRRGEQTEIEVGNLDVARDIGDVRDYVRAYRLVLERMATTDLGHPPAFLNVATGVGVELRAILDELCRMAGVSGDVRVDPALLRADDPPWLVGDASRLTAATGWRPDYSLSATLADVLAEHLTTT